MKKIRLVLALLLAAASHMVLADHDAGLEARLTKALQIKKNTEDRMAKSRPVIQAYVQAGLLSKKANERADYVDFYLLQKPASFMGHTLILLEEEYMDTYVGCCVSPGMGLTVRVNGDTTAIKKFADDNACTFTAHDDVLATLKTYGIKNKLAKDDYASLSCRARDAQK
ncbi:hypothetical protein [Undibacterium sp. TJN19]|uniref:hypothetical protein n=1 Tax=Undibacterium sp. TJN19 TaxID=3413055 RepID=UPI003BF3FE3F